MFQENSDDCAIRSYHNASKITGDGGIELNQKLPSTDEFLSHPKVAPLIFPHRNKQRSKNRIHNLKDTTKKLRLHITSTDVIKELLCPAETSFNVKICGGKRGFDVERERSKSSGYVIHPCSKIRLAITGFGKNINCPKVSYSYSTFTDFLDNTGILSLWLC